MPLSNGAARLKCGDTFDVEDSRMSWRLHAAHRILGEYGFRAVVTHCERCDHHPSNRFVINKRGYCVSGCTSVWEPQPTDEMFQLAWDIADKTQTLTGLVNRAR